MNKKRIWIVALVLALTMCLTLVLVACNNGDGDNGGGQGGQSGGQGEQGGGEQGGQGETPAPTQEELFDIWVVGRDYTMNYEGYYTFHYENLIDNGQKKDIRIESWGGDGKYFYEQSDYDLKNGEYVLDENEQKIEVVRVVDDNGTSKTKLYKKDTGFDGNAQISGTYVKPSYKPSSFHFEPAKSFDDESMINKGDTYETFIAAVKAASSEGELGEPTSMTFVKNEDDSVTFEMLFSVTMTSEEENCTATYAYKFSITVKDGKVVSNDTDVSESYVFEDESKNTSSTTLTKEHISYEFDTAAHQKYDITTADTVDGYFCSVIVMNGNTKVAEFEDYANAYDKQTLTAEELKQLMEDKGFSNFKLYADAEKTVEFVSVALDCETVIVYTNIVMVM